MSFETVKTELSNKIRPLDKQRKPSTDAYPKNSGYFLWAICGAKGAGKTSLLYNLLLHHLKGYYDNIYLVSTTCKNDKKMSDLIEELGEEEKIYTDCTPATVNEILERLQEAVDEGAKHNLVIFDDCIHQLPKSTQKNSAFNRLITTMRHFKSDVWITTQSYLKLNTIVRSNMDLFSMFHTNNKKELKSVMEDLAINEDLFEKLYDFATQDNSFLHVSFVNGKPLFFKKFDRIVL